MNRDLAIIAGTGRLPQILRDQHPDATMVSIIDSNGNPSVTDADVFAEFERLGALVRQLRKRGVKRLCFAGATVRPKLSLLRLDFATLLLLPRMLMMIKRSDGRALSGVRQIFERKGFSVVGAHELVPDLVVAEPSLLAGEFVELDIETARRAHHLMSLADDGQALVVNGRDVIAAETRAGTAAMIDGLDQTARGGFLYKTSKFGQDLAIDMATIGPETVEQASRAMLGAIVIEAQRTIVLDHDEVVAKANQTGLVVMAIAPLEAP